MRLNIPTRKIIIKDFPMTEFVDIFSENNKSMTKGKYVSVKIAATMTGASETNIRVLVRKNMIRSEIDFDHSCRFKIKILKVNVSDVLKLLKKEAIEKKIKKEGPESLLGTYIPVYSVNSDPSTVLGEKCYKIIKLVKMKYSDEQIIDELNIHKNLKEYVKSYCARLKNKYNKNEVSQNERTRGLQKSLHI
ncbi:MAG: hypothetical protein ACRC5T_09020 [Cetobacterium sp.]